jgi:hypothetical protein
MADRHPGGLEAFAEFLGETPPDGGRVFVFVLHLPPDAASYLAEILGRRARMPVRQVEHETPVEPDRGYGIRPGRVLTIRDGRASGESAILVTLRLPSRQPAGCLQECVPIRPEVHTGPGRAAGEHDLGSPEPSNGALCEVFRVGYLVVPA